MRNVESKMWNRKCGMTLIGRGVKPRGRYHSADYHKSQWQCSKMHTSSAENAGNDARIRYFDHQCNS